MRFKEIILFTVSEYNANQGRDGFIPQKGTVINVYFDGISDTNVVAVGFN